MEKIESLFEKEEVLTLDYVKNAPKKVLNDMLTYYANKKRLWNKKEIKLSKKDIKDLTTFQKIINEMGIDEKKFMSYTTV